MEESRNSEEKAAFPAGVLELLRDPACFGRMNDPTSAAYLKGPCGDSMEFYLVIEAGTIVEATYYTEGCTATRACAAMTARLARGRTVREALGISAGQIIQALEGLPEDHLHCSILSVSTLYRAIADHLLHV
jgi:nitrogen fixation NifU-like protein